MLPLCILTSFIPEELKDLGKLCCSMLGGSCGGTMEGLDENEENKRKKRERGRRGGALCFLSPRFSSFFFFFSFLFFPLALHLALLEQSDLISKTEHQLCFLNIFYSRSQFSWTGHTYTSGPGCSKLG